MPKIYDLGERTKLFARECRLLIRSLKLDMISAEDARQLIRASGSVAANYIEANESLSKKDFGYPIKVCKKEAKESGLWLELLFIAEPALSNTRDELEQDALELVRIFSSIIAKSN